MPQYGIRDLLAVDQFRALGSVEFTQVAWGYVTQPGAAGREVLVAERYKKGDELRQGQLVLPGGGLELGEGLEHAAIREVREETGVIAEPHKDLTFLTPKKPILRETDDLLYILDTDGYVWVTYKDSQKSYVGKPIPLSPAKESPEPAEQPESDAKNPHYLSLDEALRQHDSFTPACQILLNNHGLQLHSGRLEKDDDITLIGELRDYLQVREITK